MEDESCLYMISTQSAEWLFFSWLKLKHYLVEMLASDISTKNLSFLIFDSFSLLICRKCPFLNYFMSQYLPSKGNFKDPPPAWQTSSPQTDAIWSWKYQPAHWPAYSIIVFVVHNCLKKKAHFLVLSTYQTWLSPLLMFVWKTRVRLSRFQFKQCVGEDFPSSRLFVLNCSEKQLSWLKSTVPSSVLEKNVICMIIS